MPCPEVERPQGSISPGRSSHFRFPVGHFRFPFGGWRPLPSLCERSPGMVPPRHSAAHTITAAAAATHLSCRCVQSRGPAGRRGWGLSAASRWTAAPAAGGRQRARRGPLLSMHSMHKQRSTPTKTGQVPASSRLSRDTSAHARLPTPRTRTRALSPWRWSVRGSTAP